MYSQFNPLCACGCGGMVKPGKICLHGHNRPRFASLQEKFWAKVNKDGPVPQHRPELGPCWVREGTDYGKINVGLQRDVKSHRFSWELHFGPVPNGMLVCHHCDNPPCVRPDHLFLGTHATNAADRESKGRNRPALPGEGNPAAKLTEAQVLEIRRRYAAGGITQPALAPVYGVSVMAINRAIHGTYWKHLPLPS